jgi:hypothetical protein
LGGLGSNCRKKEEGAASLPLSSPSDDSQVFSPQTPAETPTQKPKCLPAETPTPDAKIPVVIPEAPAATPKTRPSPAAAKPLIAEWDWVRREAVLTLDGAKHISRNFSQLDPEKGNGSMDMTSFRMCVSGLARYQSQNQLG